jgi:PAS domain S-box-containing protein
MSTITDPGAIPLAPLPHWHDHDHDGHVVQFYTEDASLLDALSRFVGTALGAGDAAVVIGTKPHRDSLAKRLTVRGLDIGRAAEQGRYISLDAAETLAKVMVNGWPEAALFFEVMSNVMTAATAAAEGEQSRVVAFGEMVALLWEQGQPEAALRLEELWNDLARAHSFSLRCAYPMSGFCREEHSQPFLKICAEHSGVIPSESYAALPSDEERLRSITHLQQKAQALETEKAERKAVQDSLQRRESELAEILENAVEGVQQVGQDQRILWANKALLNLLGYPVEEYVNHRLAEFHVHQHIFDEFWRRLMRREDIYDFPAELKCKDGSVKHVLIHSNGLWEVGRFVHTRCFIRDVTEQKQMEQALRDSEARLRLAKDELESLVEQRTAALRHLSSQVMSLQDSERRRLARELHDSLGQYLAGLKLNVDLLRQSPENDELWSQSETLMERCIVEVRTLSYLLHPPMMDEVGFISAARWYLEGFGQRSGLEVTLSAPDGLARLPDAIELALFRMLQEALTNVHRHSGASAADVHILQDAEQVILEMKDNGHGITPELLARFNQLGAGMGVGLTGMRERVRELGGKLKLESDSGGTSVRITIPVTSGVA